MDLTRRQLAVLAAVVEEGTYAAAGERLCISPRTVRGHLVETRRRLGVDTTAQAVYVLAMRGALLCPTVGRRGTVQRGVCTDSLTEAQA